MKKYLFRILVGLLAFGIGIIATWFLYSRASYELSCNKFCISPKLKKATQQTPNGKVEVHFKEFKQTEKGLVVSLKVINNSPDSIYYTLVDSDTSPDERIKFNDEIDLPVSYCGMSSFKSKHLHSGESILFEAFALKLEPFIEKSGQLNIGYSFKKDEEESKIYWSESIPIPNWVKGEIRKEILETDICSKLYF